MANPRALLNEFETKARHAVSIQHLGSTGPPHAPTFRCKVGSHTRAHAYTHTRTHTYLRSHTRSQTHPLTYSLTHTHAHALPHTTFVHMNLLPKVTVGALASAECEGNSKKKAEQAACRSIVQTFLEWGYLNEGGCARLPASSSFLFFSAHSKIDYPPLNHPLLNHIHTFTHSHTHTLTHSHIHTFTHSHNFLSTEFEITSLVPAPGFVQVCLIFFIGDV